MRSPEVFYGQGDQPVRLVPVDRNGKAARVTSATYVIVDVGESEESTTRQVASGSATLGDVDTTTTAACGQGTADAKAVPLTSVADIVQGHSYLLTSGGRRHLVTVATIGASSVGLVHAVPEAFPTGATFQDVELEAEFPEAVANDVERIRDGDRFQIVWTYELDGEAWITAQMIDFRRYRGEAWITEADFFSGMPLLADRMRNRITPGDCIVAATQDVVGEFESSGVDASQFRTGTVGLLAVRFRAIAYALRWLNGSDDQALADKYDDRYERLIKSIIQGPGGKTVKLSQSEDQAVNPRVDGFFVKP